MPGYFESFFDFLTNTFFGQVVLLVLSVSTLINVVESVGLMPEGISKRLRKNRNSDVIMALKDLGVDFHEERRSRLFKKIYSFLRSEKEFEDRVSGDLRRDTLNGPFLVGQRHEVSIKKFIDVMSAVCNEKKAVVYARYLSTFFYKTVCVDNGFNENEFDFIVTPKSGSPILGYEFSKIIGKPLVLHNHKEQKYRMVDHEQKKGAFDADFTIAPGMKALIVDDSTTGGGKVIEAIKDLREQGCKVENCVVLFEPQAKNVSEILKNYNVKLHSIVKVS